MADIAPCLVGNDGAATGIRLPCACNFKELGSGEALALYKPGGGFLQMLSKLSRCTGRAPGETEHAWKPPESMKTWITLDATLADRLTHCCARAACRARGRGNAGEDG